VLVADGARFKGNIDMEEGGRGEAAPRLAPKGAKR
jgi:hypothetical protein